AHLSEINLHSTERRWSIDLIAAEAGGRAAEVHIQSCREHLPFEHRVHRGTARVCRFDEIRHVRADLSTGRRCAQILERIVRPQVDARVAYSTSRCAASDDPLAVLVLPEP